MSSRWHAFGWLTALALLLPGLALAQEAIPEATLPPELTAEAALAGDALSVLVSARADLELLALNLLGDARPPGWTGALSTNDPQLAVLIRLDLELLAGQMLGADQRPAGWFGAVASSPAAIARDIRHDLELLADAVIQPGVRPPGWVGSDPLMRCPRAAQSLATLLERGGYVFQADPASPAFCIAVALEASLYVEQNVGLAATLGGAAPMPAPGATGELPAGLTGTARAGVGGVAVFGDRNARTRLGVLPAGIVFAALARSTTQFSNMMLVEGDGFRVFVDFAFTSIAQDEFDALPDVNTVSPEIYCTAAWCG